MTAERPLAVIFAPLQSDCMPIAFTLPAVPMRTENNNLYAGNTPEVMSCPMPYSSSTLTTL
jgi:hypothetical protein